MSSKQTILIVAPHPDEPLILDNFESYLDHVERFIVESHR